VYKPNTYLYPNKDQVVNVKLDTSCEIIKTEPTIEGNSWNVFVDKSAKIDYKYDYLFYEAIVPNLFNNNNLVG